jgi:hypothetical protein
MSDTVPALDLLRSVSDVDAFAQFMFPSIPLSALLQLIRKARVLHVAAVHVNTAAVDDDFRSIIVGTPASPQCLHDFFLLNFVRACSDGIIETGQNVRCEPRLHTELQGPFADALRLWRAFHFPERRRKPVSLVLTRALSHAALDFRHILFTQAGASSSSSETHCVVVFVPPSSDQSVLQREIDAAIPYRDASVSIHIARPCKSVEYRAFDASDNFQSSLESGSFVTAAVQYLQAEMTCHTVSLEAGASTTAPLYRQPGNSVAVDILFLGMFRGRLIPQVVGGAVLSPGRMAELFDCVSSMQLSDQPDWSFACFVRKGLGNA